ncbi:hopanoid biosynthesis associated radical SAM protein HpnJ [Limihaloglobus sulfuriphilus]|uniref:Hopanoid biosynthesis associated radical SAM protein HpnJ n=1 Tax=Limihaloglobus sulfuriphilus TaxID=1851148 RepID=A0A1Q2MF32_9BACT|nr:radical SAM protein [Limihaloglobus sulfuriphilus]AQQ71264.1 hopanoid biosynthesis associated radical SAM protein HpnJ [Limihaloglobus sulfuriphilus]
MKIALIAMSGIRCCDAELLELGLTLPGFVERSKTIASLPSLGLLTLAGMTPAGHQVDYIEMPDLANMNNLDTDYDLVGISSYSAQINEAYELALHFKKASVPVVIGGPHVTALPDEALEFCDSAAVGQGESVWPEILNDCRRGVLRPVYGSVERDYDLACSPMPKFELLDISKYNRLTVQTSRGCPHKCDFCASSVMLTGKYNQKPPQKVLAEIDRIKQIWQKPFIEFADDNTFVNKQYWKPLLKDLKHRRIKWFAESDLSVSEDTEMLDLMRESGCAQILIGLESPTIEPLDGIDLNSNWKYKYFDKYAEAIHKIQSHGITVNGCFILGMERQGPEIFDKVFEFVKAAGLYEVQITIMTPFPGTELYRKLDAENRLIEKQNWEKCTLFDLNFIPSHMSVDQLETGFKKLAEKIYSKYFTNWRREQFKKQFRRGGD